MTSSPPRPEPGPPWSAPPDEVDRALGGLDGLVDRPLAEHVAVFERIHTALQDALAAGSAGEAAGPA